MKKFTLREKAKMLLLCMTSINLGLSSELIWLGLVFFVAFMVVFFRYDASRVPVYRKSIAYGLIVPFAIWWVLSPEVEFGISPWLVYIPAYYLLSLALLQVRSLGNGGHDVFILFNGVAAMLLSCYQGNASGIAYVLVALLFLVHAYARPGVKWWKHALFLLLLAGFSAISYAGFQYWRHHRSYGAERMANYYEKRNLMGFDPVVKLGSFESNFAGKYNSEVILRVWDSLPPYYMRAAVYEKYVGGFWKLPEVPGKKLYPARYEVDYAVFETSDSASSPERSRMVWVQSPLDNFGFLFAAPGAVGVAAKNADSLEYGESGIFSKANGKRSDWYYFVANDGANSVEGLPHGGDTLVPATLRGFLDSVAVEVGLRGDSIALPLESSLFAVGNYFAKHFEYSLVVPDAGKSGMDPLRSFWKSRRGYCEYFATLSVLLLRSQGIPARYVTGFVNPESVEGRPYAVFRRYSSHAWVEVFDGKEWKPFDPTPPVLLTRRMQPSWFSLKAESVRGWFSRVFHVLKEGSWRRTVDSWQGFAQALFGSPWLYAVMVAAVVVVLLFRAVGKRRKKDVGPTSAARGHWVRVLAHAEKSLMRLGFMRMPGETVGCFLRRLEGDSPVTQKGRARFERALDEIRDYEKNRWRL